MERALRSPVAGIEKAARPIDTESLQLGQRDGGVRHGYALANLRQAKSRRPKPVPSDTPPGLPLAEHRTPPQLPH